ncbi:MAG TPA: hypothetical protein VNO31_35530 [Umezawaea sp.]|nr:hypothetical protein [Umezawaea sp.]
MARTALTATELATTGTSPAAVDVAAEVTDGNSFTYKKGRFLYVLNGDDASLTVTLPTPGTVGRGALAIADTAVVIPAGEYRLIPIGLEHKQADSSVYVNYAGTTPVGVMVAVLDA